MIEIDGTRGEGGGQILRSSLGLSLVSGTPFRITGIRANRGKPGLMRQHLTAVRAAQQIGAATLTGDRIGSTELTFAPGPVRGGDYHFAIGTAGSTSLVLQAVLPALLVADGPSRVTIEGGTHNPFAPPFEFLVRSFLPQLARMGAEVDLRLVRPGFYPAGGGCIEVEVRPTGPGGLRPLELFERGAATAREAVAQVANLPRSVAVRELSILGRKLGFAPEELRAQILEGSPGPGNVLTVFLEFASVTAVFTGFGEASKPAERVATDCVHLIKAYRKSDAPVGRYLADQLLIPMAMAGTGGFRALPLSRHAKTNMEVIERFLPVRFRHRQEDRCAVVEVG